MDLLQFVEAVFPPLQCVAEVTAPLLLNEVSTFPAPHTDKLRHLKRCPQDCSTKPCHERSPYNLPAAIHLRKNSAWEMLQAGEWQASHCPEQP